MAENPFANLDEETQKQIQELQILEQNFQHLSRQKQAFQMEMNETNNSIEEVKKAEGDVFKLTGQVMIKKTKEKLQEELEHKKELLKKRLDNIEKQEKDFSEKVNSLRDEIMKKISQQDKQEDKENKQ
ncbi:MAG: prefoldin subunit [Candidatus Nanoarchaeia archaeon]